MEISQSAAGFPAEITGLDITQTLTATMVAAIEAAMARHAVVIVRGQKLDDAALVRFSRSFGGLELPRADGYFDGSPKRVARELFDAGNLDADGEILAEDAPSRRFGKSNALWHTDSSFNALPTKWSLLAGYVIPPEGGQTLFVDTRQAYAGLDEAFRTKIADLRVAHSLWHSRASAGFEASDSERRKMPTVEHPLVVTAANGYKALYLGAHAQRIIGMAEDESRALLDYLVAQATAQDRIYAHDWRVGDIVIWDNRCTLHRSGPFDSFKYRRDMRRTTILETPEDIDISLLQSQPG